MSHKYSPILLYRFFWGGGGQEHCQRYLSFYLYAKVFLMRILKHKWGKNFQLLCAHIYIFEDGLKERNHWHLTQFLIYSQATVFPVVICGCESQTIKKAECQRIDAFQLWCQRRLFRVPWTARRSNQSILRGINPEYSLEGLTLKLKFQYFGHVRQRANSLGQN